MMEDNVGIQPCCIDIKLPPLLEAGKDCSFFFSYGDWGLKKLWSAASKLVEPSEAFTFLSLETITRQTLFLIRRNLERDWIRGIALMIAETGKEADVLDVLNGYLDRVYFCEGRKEVENQQVWVRASKQNSLVIVGPIHHANGYKRFCQYSASLGSVERAKQVFKPYRQIFRLRATIKGTDSVFDSWLK